MTLIPIDEHMILNQLKIAYRTNRKIFEGPNLI